MAVSKRKMMTYADVIALGEKLKAVCHKDDLGYASYDEGWSDERIASETPSLTIANVANLRVQLFGKFKPGSKKDDILARLEALEKWASCRPVQPFRP